MKKFLSQQNFLVSTSTSTNEAAELLANFNYDLIILDVMMPKKDGFTLAKEIREQNTTIPIIFLTAKSQTKDVLDGFEYGGNDYLKKPFSMEELIARMKALLDRRKMNKDKDKIGIGAYIFNYTKQELLLANETIMLTHRESQLLFYLSEKRNEILDRSFILKKLWGNDDFFSSRSMDVFISKLRKKLSKDPTIKIVNIRSVGYKLII